MFQIVNKILFSIYIFLNVDNSINNGYNLLNLSVVIVDIVMEGTVSQIFYLDPRSYFM